MNATHRTFESRNDLPQRLRDTLTPMLNEQLAATFDLYSQVKQVHWNVKGMQFMFLHLLFDELVASLLIFVDEIGERIAALDGTALGTVHIAATNSYLADLPPGLVEDTQVVTVLATRFAQYNASIRQMSQVAADYGDTATADLFTTILRKADKHLWLLETHLQVDA